jgi:2-polyprenyl-3-methyl-5-hydroxy-6-metoxy-1,4-benzoquinol methylase
MEFPMENQKKRKENLDNYIVAYDQGQLYNYDIDIWHKWYTKRLKELFKGEKCLELGIGHGFTTHVFSKHFQSYKVIEGSPKIIEKFKQTLPDSNIDIELSYFEDFESSEVFDVIIMGYILEHVDDPELILKKYKDFLSENGSIFVIVPNGSALNRRFGLKAGFIKSLDEISDFDLTFGHKRTFTYESLLDLVKQCGFEIERCEGIFLKPMSTKQMVAANIPESIIEAMCEVAVEYPELSACILLELK